MTDERTHLDTHHYACGCTRFAVTYEQSVNMFEFCPVHEEPLRQITTKGVWVDLVGGNRDFTRTRNAHAHDGDCAEVILESERELRRFQDEWPHYCRTCAARGEHHYEEDPSPSGVGLSPGTICFYDPCVCTENGFCPRCGTRAWDVDSGEDVGEECASCSWRFDDATKHAPPVAPCVCFERDCPDDWTPY